MNFQPLIDNFPMILAALGLILWAASRFVDSRAKANPAIDKWDKWAPKLQWASGMYSQALDWLCDSGHLKFKGQEKLVELNRLTSEFEKAIANGDYRLAIDAVWGYYIDAKVKKQAKALPNPLTADSPAQD